MGAILINVPDIPDSELFYDENETRLILKFFWPHRAQEIEGMAIDNSARRLAQTALIAAIDASYALGFIDILSQSVIRPGSGIKSLGKKLARRFIKHWWKNTKQKELEDVRIYESVRKVIAGNLAGRFELLRQGLMSRRRNIPFYAIASQSDLVWA